MEESLYRKGKYKHMENGEVEMNECMENEIMQQDLEMLVDSDLPITALEGKSVLVTGATGLIGRRWYICLHVITECVTFRFILLLWCVMKKKGKRCFRI